MEKDNQLGHLVLNEDGAVISSGGELENSESVAQIIFNLVNMSESIDTNVFPKNSCRKISIVYNKHTYEVFLSNRKIYVYKKANQENLVDV